MRATNYARASYQEVYDIMTRDGKISMFAFHTPVGYGPYSFLGGFFRQFKKYRYGGLKVSVIPAAQLPADPLQISYEAGTESYIDPRDLQNPILFHGAHGNNLGQVMNMIYSTRFGGEVGRFTADSAGVESIYDSDTKLGSGDTNLEDWYYASMLDPTFRKFNVMNNFTLPYMTPRVHMMATDLRIQPNFTQANTFVEDTPQIGKYASTYNYMDDVVPMIGETVPDGEGTKIDATPQYLNLMSGRTVRLGWMDTYTFQKVPGSQLTTPANNGTTDTDRPTLSPLPRIMMGVMILPPSYRTKLAFRVVLTHSFEFARFNTSVTPTSIAPPDMSIARQSIQYHDFLPDEITSTNTVALAESIDAINGDVHQSVSGVL